jgi:5'-nucleotidase
MHVLLTNDDGIHAKGLAILASELKDLGSLSIVAPDTERSATGHAITLLEPLRVQEVHTNGELYGYAVNGTPADCVKLAVKALLEKPPDILVSGINLGPNTGVNVIYSGTVSAATEGTIYGIPSIAISLGTFENADFLPAAKFAHYLAGKMLEKGLPPGTLLNVNIPPLPADKIAGVKITRQGDTRFDEVFDRRVDPRRNVYYWMTGEIVRHVHNEDTDDVALENGYISITPIHYDMTNHTFLPVLKDWCISGELFD